MSSCLEAGAASADVTPGRAHFLYGYPHVQRMSTGTHDPLLAAALFLQNGDESCLFISVDVIFVSRALTQRIRQRVSSACGIKEAAILLSATHTHSGPVTVDYLSNEADLVVPRADARYLKQLEDGIVAAGIRAWENRRPARLAVTHADATGIGTCRHDPQGPCDLDVPVLAVREAETAKFIGLLLVCAMHPTVLHEDSTRYSGDFPAFARQHLQQRVTGSDCPIIYHTGASGDQSPRHVTKANTFAEAERLGRILGHAVERALAGAEYSKEVTLAAAHVLVDLPAREAPGVEEAERHIAHARARFNALKGHGTSRAALRSAECDLFGAEEMAAIARAAEQGRLQEALHTCLPAEVQVIVVGSQLLVAWPGEFFVEFALRVRAVRPEASVITLANGDLQGYVVTQQAVDNRWYEAGNALLKSPDAGDRIVEATLELIEQITRPVHA